jgi:HEAT repeat protein
MKTEIFNCSVLVTPARRTILQGCILLLWIIWAGGLLCSGFVCLAAEQTGDDAAKAVLDLLRSSDPELQTVAITMVRDLPGKKEITEALIKELPNLSTTGQIQLLAALADRGDRTALPAVVNSTKSKEASVRIAALKAIGQLGDASIVTLLAQTAANSKSEEQKAARESLYRLRDLRVDKEILTLISSADTLVKAELIRSIAQRNIEAGVETLLKTAADADTTISIESFKALKVIAKEKDLPALIEQLLTIDRESIRNEAEKTIAAVVVKNENKKRRSELVLAALAKAKDTEDRCSLLRVLGRIGDDSSIPAIQTALKSNDSKEQDSAIRVLSNWLNPMPINDLLTIAQTSKNQIHRILALRGFVRLIALDENRPADEAIRMYQQAMELSENASERKIVLSGLANVKSLAALEMAASYLNDSDLQQEAEAAVVKIAEGVYKDRPQQTNDILNKIIQTSKNDSLRWKAQEIITQITIAQTKESKTQPEK